MRRPVPQSRPARQWLRRWSSGATRLSSGGSLAGRPAPGESPGRQDAVNEKGEWGDRDQRDVKRWPHLHEEREIVAQDRNRGREQETAEPRVGRGARIGDHEECKDQKRAALQLVDRDRDRIAE